MSTTNQSEQISDLAKALNAAQSKLKPALKDSTNPHFRSKYAGLQSVWEAARPALTANGLSVAQTFGETSGEVVTIVTTLLHTSGQWMRSTLTLKPTKADPQGMGSAITYGRRYGLAAILGIVADEDDDGNGASRREEDDDIGTPVPSLPAAWDRWTLEERGMNRAAAGVEALRHWFDQLTVADKKTVKPQLDEWKAIAAAVPHVNGR
jgi:hypothetical protein